MSNFRTLHPQIADNVLNVANLTELNAIGDPQLGDFRFVVAEDTLYVYASGGWEISGAGGSISPPDPAVSTDNAIVRWDGTSAASVQNSTATISDNGGLTVSANETTAGIVVSNSNTAGRGITIDHTGNGSTGRSLDITQRGTSSAINVDRNHAGSSGRYALSINTRDGGAGAAAVRGNSAGSGSLGSGVVGIVTDASSTRTGTTTNTSTTVTGLSQTFDLAVGYSVTGSGIPGSTTIATIIDSTSITLSQAATADATVSLVFSKVGDGIGLLAWDTATGTNSKALAISNHSTGSHVGFNAPASSFTSYAMTLPGAQGAANQTLVNDGSGNLVWTNQVVDAINDAVTTTAPSQNAVFDALALKQSTSEKGNPDGYASLDGGGKVPVAQLPATLMTYEGTWDASTNTPTLANGTGDAGMVYIVNGAGTVNFGAGNITFAIGDWVIYNGTIWQKSDNADDVVSVNGYTGVVTLGYTDVNAISEMGTVVNHRLVRTQGTTGELVEQTGVTVNNSNHMSGVAQLDVDNVRIDANTVSATSGDLTLNAGANVVNVEAANMFLRAGADLSFYDNDNSNSVTISVPSNVTSNRTPQIPDDTGNFVLTSAAQQLTAKDIDGGTASNTSRITVPKDSKTNLDALTRKEATVVYASDEDRLYVDNGTSLVAVGSSNATGTGETNYVSANPSAATVIAGWTNVGDLDVARTTTLSELPREYTTATGIKITADANTQSNADYVYFDFTLDDVDLNKKLKIQWSQKQFGAYVAGRLAVIITTQADRTTAVATPDVTAIPAYDGVFTASFDTASTATLSLVIRATADMATDTGVVISDVIVGPGTIVAAAPIGTWQSYTPISSFNTNANTPTGRWRQVGDTMEVEIRQSFTGAPNSTTFTASIPTGYTIDTTKIVDPSAGGSILGVMTAFDGANAYSGNAVYASTTTVRGYGPNGSANWTQAVPFTLGSGDAIEGRFVVPISEWAGAPNYAGQNDVEYAYTSDTWNGTGSTTAYGTSGQQMAGALTLSRLKTVTWLTPIQKTDEVTLQLSLDGNTWVNSASIAPFILDSATAVDTSGGVRIQASTTTTTAVQFCRYQYVANDDSPVVDWPATMYWRVVKARAGAAVGFGAATATASGLVDTGTQSFAGNKTFTGNVALGGLRVGIATESGGAGTYTPDVTNLGAYVFDGTGAKTVNTINGGVDGKVLFIIQQSNAGNSLLLTNAGNIRTASGATVTIVNNGGMTLVYQNGGWQEISSGL